ncbi:S1/P1 nuclease [Curvibacter sp. APW13]|uniref:S1/P1 nuclease n=1 Tax=Curvibacter sp. APW13 TaxID=3077236 RepID=UPI0028DDC9A3|nr:S1/P1 nuclease [Curvibacter sp. APW13]MDT8992642.1 S1/P1 nuclease [Curvibacter sp. APW13]
MKLLSTLLAAALALIPSVHAHAWGVEGHQIIAAIAQSQLQPAAAKEVQRLLALEPGATLVSISTWADEHRNPATAPWHYVNFPKGNCQYVPERDCPDGKCVVEAIRKQSDILQFEANDEKRLTALKYLVHLVGDIHQPLHAGWGEDRGGNSYQLQAFMRGSNLHAWWDTGMIKYLEEQEGPLLPVLQAHKPMAMLKDWKPEAVAEESCRIVDQEGFYPGRLVDVGYIERYRDTLGQRLHTAGMRLAGLLNKVLQP